MSMIITNLIQLKTRVLENKLQIQNTHPSKCYMYKKVLRQISSDKTELAVYVI